MKTMKALLPHKMITFYSFMMVDGEIAFDLNPKECHAMYCMPCKDYYTIIAEKVRFRSYKQSLDENERENGMIN